jgi:hypothetical protein
LILLGGASLVALVGAGVQLSVVPLRSWRGLRGFSRQEAVALGLTVCATLMMVQIGTTEWEGLRLSLMNDADAFRQAFWQRPEWLFPVVVGSIALFFGAFAIHAFRRAGVATLVGLFVVAARVLMLGLARAESSSFGYALGATAHLMLLAPFLALDAWYAVRRRRASASSTLIGGSLLAGVACLVAGLPLIASTMEYPRINGDTLPGMIGMSLAMALAAGWAGARFGGWLGSLDRRSEYVPVGPRTVRTALAALAVSVVLTLAIVLTAQPPVV